MAPNDVIILDSILDQVKAKAPSTEDDDEYFELFCFEQVLKAYDLSNDELTSGRTGGPDDGGFDGFFSFINGELLHEDTDLAAVKKEPRVELHLVQAKRTASFSETALDHAIASVTNLFDLTKDLNALRKFYNPALVDQAEMFRDAYIELAGRHPSLLITFWYVAKGDRTEIHPKVKEKGENLAQQIRGAFTGAEVLTFFLGARELLEATRIKKSYTLQLNFLENYISRGADDYVVLAKLSDYFEFVSDEHKNLRRYIFESNVRDYQGDVEVNRDIRRTLATMADKLDFWYLNNGITVLASKASIVGKSITLDDVQVVNGLQTTQTIFEYVKESKGAAVGTDSRAILIKIIVTTNAEARDRIIKAANFQTAIPPASLRATDRIQRDIEDFFKQKGWFYDRRKNYYKNMGEPAERIVSIPYLAQALMAMALREPDNSRARPSSLIKSDSDYGRVFSEAFEPELYLFCAKTMKIIDSFIRSTDLGPSLQERTNLRFHLATVAVIKLLNAREYSTAMVATLAGREVGTGLLEHALSELLKHATEFETSHGWPPERVAKSKEFVKYLADRITLGSVTDTSGSQNFPDAPTEAG